MEDEARQLILKSVAGNDAPPRKGIFEMLYEASRPGFELPIPPRSPARIPTFDDE
jgi:hypothetical protein